MTVAVETAIRSVFAFFLLLIVCRWVGRKVISQFTFFDFATGITIGSLAAMLAAPQSNQWLGIPIALVMFMLLTVLMDYADLKSYRLRKLVNSEPVVLVENGKLVKENMRKVRVSLDQLQMMLRQNKVFNMGDVEFAVMESSGRLSVLLKSQRQPATPADLGLPTAYKGLTRDLIMDGEIRDENLTAVGLDREWLRHELEAKGVEEPEEVFYAGLDTEGALYVSLKENIPREREGQHGIE